GRPDLAGQGKALAIAGARLTGTYRVREAELPALVAEVFESVGEYRNVESDAGQHLRDQAIQSIGDDRHGNAVALTERNEIRKIRVEGYFFANLVELLGRCAQHRHLFAHAFAGADAAREPFCFHLLPSRIGKPLEDDVGRILKRDRPVEIDENAKP